MVSTAIALRPAEKQLVQLVAEVPPEALRQLGKDPSVPVQLPFYVEQQPSESETRRRVAVAVGTAAVGTSAAVASLGGAYWLGGVAIERGYPLVQTFATLDWSNPATMTAAAIAGGAAALGAAGLYSGIKATLVDLPKVARPLWSPLNGQESPALNQTAQEYGIKRKTIATQVLSAVAAAGAAVALFATAPVSLVAAGVGAAAAVGAFFFGRAAAKAAVALQGPAVQEYIQIEAQKRVFQYIDEEAAKAVPEAQQAAS